MLITVGRSQLHRRGLTMAIKKLNDGRYEVDIRPNGKMVMSQKRYLIAR